MTVDETHAWARALTVRSVNFEAYRAVLLFNTDDDEESGSEIQAVINLAPSQLPSVTGLIELVDAGLLSISTNSLGGLILGHAGKSLTFDASEEYEAWEFTLSSGKKVICMPGGDLAIFE